MERQLRIASHSDAIGCRKPPCRASSAFCSRRSSFAGIKSLKRVAGGSAKSCAGLALRHAAFS